MAMVYSASESPSEEGTRNVPRSDPTPDNDSEGCPGNSSNFFSINFWNISGLRSNFHSTEHHLSSSKPHLLFLTETQVFGATNSSLYSVPSYFLYHKFQNKAGCCVYVSKLFRLCLPTSAFPFCWKYAYIQPVPKKGDRSNPSNNRPIALLPCLSRAFETIINKKILKHLFASNFLSDRQYGFRKGRSTGDILPFLTSSWPSSLSRFSETFAVALDMSKTFDRVWHKSLLSKLPYFGFYTSLCSFISSFLSGRSISDIVDGHCSTPQPINTGVLQGAVLSPTLFLLFINDLFSINNCPLHSYADDSTLLHLLQ